MDFVEAREVVTLDDSQTYIAFDENDCLHAEWMSDYDDDDYWFDWFGNESHDYNHDD